MTDVPQDLETASSAAMQFSEMARKITENATNGFSGAVVVVPPNGDPINLLMVSPMGDESLFWATLQTQVQIRLKQIQDRETHVGAWR